MTGSSDGTIKITSLRLETQSFTEIIKLNCGRNEEVISVAELRNYMIAGASLNKMFFWALDNADKPLKVINTHTMPLYKLITVDDGLFLISVGKDGKLGVWKGKN